MTYPMDDRADQDTGQMDAGINEFAPPGLYVGPGNDDPIPVTAGADVDTPDPFATGGEDQAAYQPGTGGPVDTGVQYRPPWPLTRAPGTVPTVAPGRIVPVNPWLPTIALLNARQVALLNRISAARQAARMWVDDPHST